jgi:hypothetical protein
MLQLLADDLATTAAAPSGRWCPSMIAVIVKDSAHVFQHMRKCNCQLQMAPQKMNVKQLSQGMHNFKVSGQIFSLCAAFSLREWIQPQGIRRHPAAHARSCHVSRCGVRSLPNSVPLVARAGGRTTCMPKLYFMAAAEARTHQTWCWCTNV